jgi:methylaspartate ammonia-lyase
MRVTIIPADGFVSVDGEGYSEIDLSFIDSDIHAVQWYDIEGEIERKGAKGRIVSNEELNTFDDYQAAVDAWAVRKQQVEEAAAETARQAELNTEVSE